MVLIEECGVFNMRKHDSFNRFIRYNQRRRQQRLGMKLGSQRGESRSYGIRYDSTSLLDRVDYDCALACLKACLENLLSHPAVRLDRYKLIGGHELPDARPTDFEILADAATKKPEYFL